MCPNIWGAKGNVYRILLYVYKILPYISSIAWIIRINTIYHNKLLPSSSKMLSSSSKMLSSSSKMLSSSSGNAIIVIEDAIIVIGKCYHRHREMLSSSSGNAIIVIEDAIIVIEDAIIVIGKCYHRQQRRGHLFRGLLSSSIEVMSSFRGLLSSSIEVMSSRSQTYWCRLHDSDLTVSTIAISSSRRLFVFLHHTIYYQWMWYLKLISFDLKIFLIRIL